MKRMSSQQAATSKKTILIPITRAFIIRNVLRAGGYRLLKERGYRLVLVIMARYVPEYLREEFDDPDTIVVEAPALSLSRLHRLTIMVTTFLLFTGSTERYLKYGNARLLKRPRLLTYAHLALVYTLSKMPFLKSVMRRIEMLFAEHNRRLAELFDQYQPDLVFSTSVISRLDIACMKEAKRRGIATVSMPKGWDNVTRNYYRYVPDHFLVQNEILKERIVALQNFPAERIQVIGFPQFDFYAHPQKLRNREEHLARYGLDPKLPLLLFGSEGVWANHDHLIARKIYDWVARDELAVPCQMLVRPHFTNVKEGLFDWFDEKPRVAVDRSYRISDAFFDNWDPSAAESLELANTLYHSAALVTVISTLNLDAVCFDKPLVNIAYGVKYRKAKDISSRLYDSDHFQWVLSRGGVDIVYNERELLAALNTALTAPEVRAEGRARLREDLCYRVDGQSSQRLVAALDALTTAV